MMMKIWVPRAERWKDSELSNLHELNLEEGGKDNNVLYPMYEVL